MTVVRVRGFEPADRGSVARLGRVVDGDRKTIHANFRRVFARPDRTRAPGAKRPGRAASARLARRPAAAQGSSWGGGPG